MTPAQIADLVGRLTEISRNFTRKGGWTAASTLNEAIAALDALAREREMELHASVPPGYKCSDCTIDGEPCPRCYTHAWQERHPNVVRLSPIPPTEGGHS